MKGGTASKKLVIGARELPESRRHRMIGKVERAGSNWPIGRPLDIPRPELGCLWNDFYLVSAVPVCVNRSHDNGPPEEVPA